MLTEEQFKDRGFHERGEFVSSAPAPPAPPSPSFEIPRWTTAERIEALAAAAPPPPERVDALGEMKAAAGDDDWPELPGPPLKYEPVPRFEVPEANWQQELAERALREQQERARQRRLEQLARLIDEEGT